MKKVLVVEHDMMNRAAAREQLNGINGNPDVGLVIVSTFERAQEILSVKHDFDVVITDSLTSERSKRGILLANLAIKNGAKLAVVFMDINQDPSADIFFNENQTAPVVQEVGTAKLVLCTNQHCVKNLLEANLAKLATTGVDLRLSVRAKDFRDILNILPK